MRLSERLIICKRLNELEHVYKRKLTVNYVKHVVRREFIPKVYD